MRILVVDIGGTNVKVKLSDSDEVRKFPSGPTLTPELLMEGIRNVAGDWQYDCVSVGYPGPVLRESILQEPANLARGWLNFNFNQAFGKSVKLLNDAAMQALGSYDGGRMLFLGLGTGLGTTLIIDGVVAPMELGHLPYKKKKSFEDYVGNAGRTRLGNKKWQVAVHDVTTRLKHALVADYVVLGGGNAKKLTELPPGSRAGSNLNAFVGGVRAWQE
jgi:predicted NBD/HSP70 family sugar kinase